MLAVKNWSQRSKIVVTGVGVTAILLLLLFAVYYGQSIRQLKATCIDKARAVCVATESAHASNAGNIQSEDHWKAARKMAADGGYSFYTPVIEPVNPDNKANEKQAAAIAVLNEGKESEHQYVDRSANTLHYLRPIRLQKACLDCHEGVKNAAGEPTHGAMEVVQSLDAGKSALAGTMRTGMMLFGLASLAGLLIMAGIYMWVITVSVNRPVQRLADALFEGSRQIAGAAADLSNSSQAVAQGSHEQEEAIGETNTAMTTLTTVTGQSTEHARRAATMVDDAMQRVGRASERAMDMDRSMNEIREASGQTSKIIKTIDEIAFQTNLLALNAAVEAARAGEAGKGFAVVAEEVRSLARRSAESARNTSELIEDTLNRVASGVRVVEDLKKALDDVAVSSRNVNGLVAQIADSSNKQTGGLDQVNGSINRIGTVTRQNAAVAERTASAAEELSAQSESLRGNVVELAELINGRHT